MNFVVIKYTAPNVKYNMEKKKKKKFQEIFEETISDVIADECYPDEIKFELKLCYYLLRKN